MTAQETFLPILDPFSLGGFWDKRLKCTTHMNDEGSGDNTSLKKSLKIPGVRRSHNLNKGRQ